MSKKNNRNYYINIQKNDGSVVRVITKKIRRMYHFLQAVKNSEINKIYIRVDYGVIKNNMGKKVKAINDGEYQTKSEARHALQCFARER